MPTRNLQYIDGSSRKFWRITLSGKSHTVTYGKIGTAGRTVTKSFDRATDAKASYSNLVSAKLSKGYTDSSTAKSKRKTTKPTKKSMKAAPDELRSVRDCWHAISSWLRDNYEGAAFKVPDGVKAAEIAKVEKAFGRRLPKDFRESLKVQCSTSIPSPHEEALWGHDHAYFLMTPSACLGEWSMLTDLYDQGEFTHSDARVKAGNGVVKQWWSPGWFPFAENGAGDHYCIDLCPTYPGVVGQVILFTHDSPSRPVFARSFAEFMANLADAVSKGHYIWNNEKFALQRSRKTAFPYAGG